MSLRSTVHQLTADHLTHTPLGYATAPPLLSQLEAAIKPSGRGAAAGGSGRGEVINLTALALWEEIAADISIHTQEAGLTPKPDRIETLKLWTIMDSDDDWNEFLTHVTQDWCDRITALLSPMKPYHPSQPCPSCGLKFYGDENTPPLSVHYLSPDGEQLHPEQWKMECAACEAEWEGDTLGHVARAMSA